MRELFFNSHFLSFEIYALRGNMSTIDLRGPLRKNYTAQFYLTSGPGPDPRAKSKVRIFRKDGMLIKEFQAYPDNIRLGVKVSTGRIGK